MRKYVYFNYSICLWLLDIGCINTVVVNISKFSLLCVYQLLKLL